MYTEEQFIKLEQEERELTDEAILAMLLLLGTLRGDLEKELRSFYQKYGKDGVVTYSEARKWISEQNHQRRLTALTLLIGASFADALNNIEPHFRRFLTEVISKESTFFNTEIDEGKILSHNWGADDSNWYDRLENDVLLWQTYIATDIKRGIHQRKNIAEVLAQLDKRFSSIESVLKGLGITESTAIGSMARLEIFIELGITKYQFFTNPDERRCEVCGSMHGLIFPISAYEVGVTASPIHPRCRCWEVPIME